MALAGEDVVADSLGVLVVLLAVEVADDVGSGSGASSEHAVRATAQARATAAVTPERRSGTGRRVIHPSSHASHASQSPHARA